jgi:hypothetical protein
MRANDVLGVALLLTVGCGDTTAGLHSLDDNSGGGRASGGGGSGGYGGGPIDTAPELIFDAGSAGGSGGAGGGGVTDPGAPADAGNPGPATKQGVVTVWSTRTSGGSAYGTANAWFGQGEDAVGCDAPVAIGPCIAHSCPLTAAEVDSDNAGTLTVTGTANEVTMGYAPGGVNQYFWEQTGQLFNGGETLTASSSGNTVPAFSGLMVTAPAEVSLPAPVCYGTCGTLDISTDYSLTWTGGGSVWLRAQALHLTARKLLDCYLPSSPAVVPAQALTQLGAGYGADLQIYSYASSSKVMGDYAITFRAANLITAGTMQTTTP